MGVGPFWAVGAAGAEISWDEAQVSPWCSLEGLVCPHLQPLGHLSTPELSRCHLRTWGHPRALQVSPHLGTPQLRALWGEGGRDPLWLPGQESSVQETLLELGHVPFTLSCPCPGLLSQPLAAPGTRILCPIPAPYPEGGRTVTLCKQPSINVTAPRLALWVLAFSIFYFIFCAAVSEVKVGLGAWDMGVIFLDFWNEVSVELWEQSTPRAPFQPQLFCDPLTNHPKSPEPQSLGELQPGCSQGQRGRQDVPCSRGFPFPGISFPPFPGISLSRDVISSFSRDFISPCSRGFPCQGFNFILFQRFHFLPFPGEKTQTTG